MKLIGLIIVLSLVVAVHTQCVYYAAQGCDFRCSCCRSTGITNYDCQTCTTNYYMWVSAPYRCENYCPPGEYKNTSTTCDNCHTYCATCNGSSYTNCQSCATNAFLFNSTTCYNEGTKSYKGLISYYNPCVDGYYAWPLTMTCRACPVGATFCSLALEYMMPASYQSSKTMTSGCTNDPDCLYAMKSYFCSTTLGYVWVQFFCQPINQCRQYAYYNSSSSTFDASACVCLDNYYQSGVMSCKRCDISCQKCSFNLATSCTECPYGFNKNSSSQCQTNGTTIQIESWGTTGTSQLTASMSGATYTATSSIFTTDCGNTTKRYLWGCTQATCYRGNLRYLLPSGLGTDHYAVRIRFVAIFIDNWPSSGAIWVRQNSKDVFFYNYNSYGVVGEYLCFRNVLDVVQVIDGWWNHDDDSLDFTLYNNGQDVGDYYLGIRQFIIYKMICHSSCLTCSGPTEDDCLTCHTATEIVFNGTCEPTTGDCPNYPTTPGKCVCDTSKGYFFDGTSCVHSCPNNATDFKDKASRECVTSCPQPLVFGDTSDIHRLCRLKCTTDYYKDDSSSPKICKSSCYQAGVANNLNYYKFNGTDPRCYNVCPQGYLGDEYLGACVEKCTDGYYNDSNYCYLTCPSGKYAYNVSNTCESDCPDGYFQNNKTGTSEGICQYPCTSWSGTKLYGDNSTGDCVDQCPAGTFGDPYTDLCVEICDLSAGYYGQVVGTVGTCVTMCTANQTNTGLSFGNPITGLCVNASDCPLNYYADSYASGGSQNMCVVSCTDPLEFGVNSTRSCSTSCGVGFKYNVTKVCVEICPTVPSLFGQENGHCVAGCSGNYYADAQANRTCRLNCSETPSMSFGQNNVCIFRCQNLSSTNPTWGDPYSTTRACTTNCTFNSVNQSYGYTPLNLCVKKCLDSWFGYIQANGIPICTQTCPLSLNYFGDNLTNQCTTDCPPLYFGDPTGNRLCVKKCPSTYFAYEDANGLRTCTQTCPTGYADNLTRVCVTTYTGCGNGTYGNDGDNKCQLPGTLCPNFADPTTQSCQAICPFSASVRYFGDPSTYMCVLICPNYTTTAPLGLFGDNHTKICEQTCSLTTEVRDFQNDRRCVEDWNCSRTPLALYADLVNKLCVDVKECPPATFADNHTNKCQTTCQGTQYLYADPESRFCVERCPDNYYAVNDTVLDGICNTTCVVPLYGDNQTDQCTLLCTAGTYGVKYNQGVWEKGVCQEECPDGQFARDGDNVCVDDCGAGLFGNALIRKCVTLPSQCQEGYYANDVSNLCVLPEDCQTVGPIDYVADNSTHTCVSMCPLTQPKNYADLDKRLCVALCPSGKFGQNDTLQCHDECMDYTTSTYKGSFADPQLRICVETCSADPTPTYGQNDTYTCVEALDCPTSTWAEVEVYNRQCRPICPPPNTRNANVQKYSDDTTKKCVETCPQNYYGSTWTGVGVCVDLCEVDTLFADNVSKTCVPTCPDTPISTFGDQDTRTCVSVCPVDFFAQTPSRYCVDVCRSGTWGDVLSRICLTDNTACPIVNKIKQYADNDSHLCVSQCPSTPDTWGQNSTWYCVPTCLTGFKYLPTRVCIDICPLYLNGTGLFSDDGMCYADCQTQDFYRDPQAWRSCVQFCSETPNQSYADDTTMNCVEICPSYPQMYYAFDGNDTCNLDCPGSTHKNPLTQKCVDTCPDGTILDTNTDTCVEHCPYDLTNIWYADLTAAEPICVLAADCPTDYFADFETRTCTQTCPTGYYKQNASKLCVIFCPDGQYGSETGYCVTPLNCPTDQYANNMTKTCVSICNGSFAYTTDKVCVFQCPSGLYADTYTRICADNCTNNATVQLYISSDNQTCQSHCVPPLFLNVLSNTCQSGCPSPYFADPSTRTCVESCPASPQLYGFQDDRTCVEFCPTGTPQYYTNNQTRMCVTVCDTDYYRDPLLLSCTSACTDPYFIEPDLGDCVLNCSTKFALDVNNTCLTTCPSPYYNDPTTFKCVINCPVSPMHYSLVVGTSRTCTTGCPSGKWADPNSKSCVTQCPLSPLLFADNSTWKCVTTCPYSNSGTPYSTYALSSTRMCVNICPGGMFAQNTTRSCVSVCPNGTDTYADGLLAVPSCVTLCSSGTYADLVTLTCNADCPSSPRTYRYSNTTHRICVATCPYPTVADNSTYTCVTSCLDDSLPYLDRSTWQCVASCPADINFFGYLLTGTTNDGQCVNVCPGGYFSDNTTRTCVPKCPDGYYGQTENNTCNTDCLVINDHFADPTNNLCVPVCKYNGTYDSYGDKYTRKCVTACNVSDYTYADSQTRLCEKTCTNIPLVQYKDPTTMKCVTQCPNAPPTRYFSDPVTMTCVTQCSLESKRYGYITDRTCELVCPGGLFANDDTRLCVVADDCQDDYFADDSTWTCVAICPTSQNTFGEPLNQVCALDCQSGYFRDPSTRLCVERCPATPNLFADNGTSDCVARCPPGSYADNVSRVCVSQCPSQPKQTFADNSTNLCVEICPTQPDYFSENNTWTCVDVCSSSYDMYADYSTRKCVYTCPSDGNNTFADNQTRLCVNRCPDAPIKTFNDNSTQRCKTSCTTGFSDNITKFCVLQCPDYYYGETITHTCVSVCPITIPKLFAEDPSRMCVTGCNATLGLFADNYTSRCVEVCPEVDGTFAENSSRSCVSQCSSNPLTFADSSTRTCVTTCPTVPAMYGINGSRVCTQNCPSGSFADNSSRLCVAYCNTTNPMTYGDNSTWSCVAKCPSKPWYFADQASHLCVDICPGDTYGDNSTRKCVFPCDDPSTFADITTKECVTTCPDDYFGNPLSYRCETGCPDGYFADILLHLCVQKCSVDPIYYGNPLTNRCVGQCPIETASFGNPLSQQCVTFNSSGYSGCPQFHFSDNSTRLCVPVCPMKWDTYSDNFTRKCVSICPNSTKDTYADNSTMRCVDLCPEMPDYYAQENSRRCVKNCLAPTLTFSGTFASNYTRRCVSRCPSDPDYYSDNLTVRCVRNCPVNPLTFADNSTRRCVSICPDTPEDLYGDLKSRRCVLNCPEQQFTFADNSTRRCERVCNHTALLFGLNRTRRCVRDCQVGTYADNSSRLCVAVCPDYQDTYGDPTSNKCVSLCEVGYFADPFSQTCVRQCPFLTTPIVVKTYGNLFTRRCVADCPRDKYTYADDLSHTCTDPCPESEGTYGDDTTKRCVTQCPDVPFLYAENITRRCAAICPNMTGGGFAENISRVCVTKCPDLTYGDPISLYCKFYCQQGWWGEDINNTCVQTCPDGTYADNTTWKCVSVCPVSHLLFGVPLTKTCDPACPDGTYADALTQVCQTGCPASQDTYAHDGNNTCVKECPFPLLAYNVTRVCLDVCPDPYYPNIQDHRCYRCPLQCAICLYTLACTKCVSGFYLYDGQCVESCPIVPVVTYANVNGTCGNSLQCSAGYFALNATKTCVTNCPAGYYKNTILQTCQYCMKGCINCTVYSICLQCNSLTALWDNYTCYPFCSRLKRFYYGSGCIGACPAGTFLNLTFCTVCDAMCKTCEIQPSNCLTCADGLYLQNHLCVSTCPNNSRPVLQGNSLICKICGEDGLDCSSKTKLNYTVNQTIEDFKYKLYLAFNQPVNITGNLKNIFQIVQVAARRLLATSTVNYTIIDYGNGVFGFLIDGFDASLVDGFRFELQLLDPTAIKGSETGDIPQQTRIEIIVPQNNFYVVKETDKHFANYAALVTWLSLLIIVGLCWAKAQAWIPMMDILQFIFLMYFVNVVWPPSLTYMLAAFEYSFFNFMPNMFGSVLPKPVPSANLNGQIYSLLGDATFLRSAGYLLTITLFLLLFVGLMILLTKNKSIIKDNNNRLKLKKIWKQNILNRCIHSLTYVFFLPTVFYAFLQMLDYNVVYPVTGFSIFCSLVYLIVMLVLVAWLLYKTIVFWRKYPRTMEALARAYELISKYPVATMETDENKFQLDGNQIDLRSLSEPRINGKLILPMQIETHFSKSALAAPFISYGFKFFCAIFIVACFKNPLAQLLLNLALTIILLGYHAKVQPYIYKRGKYMLRNWLTYANKTMMILIQLALIVFQIQYTQLDESGRVVIAEIACYLITFTITYNLLWLMYRFYDEWHHKIWRPFVYSQCFKENFPIQHFAYVEQYEKERQEENKTHKKNRKKLRKEVEDLDKVHAKLEVKLEEEEEHKIRVANVNLRPTQKQILQKDIENFMVEVYEKDRSQSNKTSSSLSKKQRKQMVQQIFNESKIQRHDKQQDFVVMPVPVRPRRQPTEQVAIESSQPQERTEPMDEYSYQEYEEEYPEDTDLREILAGSGYKGNVVLP